MPEERPLEYCVCCGEATGRAGIGEDSLYCDACDRGPFCPACWEFGDHEELAQEIERRQDAEWWREYWQESCGKAAEVIGAISKTLTDGRGTHLECLAGLVVDQKAQLAQALEALRRLAGYPTGPNSEFMVGAARHMQRIASRAIKEIEAKGESQ